MASDLPTPEQSVLSRYLGAANIKLFCDLATGIRYITTARNLLGGLRHQLALGGVDSGARHWMLRDGTMLSAARFGGGDRIIITPQQPQGASTAIKIMVYFLESGFVKITQLYPLDARHKPAGLLFYGEKQKAAFALWNDPDKKFAQHPPTDVPWLDHLDVWMRSAEGATVPPGENPYRFKQVRAYQPGQASLAIAADGLIKRLAWLMSDIGAATGKMKLLLQSQMGRKGDYGAAFVLQYGATPTIGVTYGVLTPDDFDYVLLRLSQTGIDWKPLRVDPVVRRMVARMAKGQTDKRPPPDEITRMEGYALTTAQDSADWQSVTFSAPFEVQGAPFYYGWKANEAGDQWCAVTTEPIYQGERILYHIARRYGVTLQVERDQKDAVVGIVGTWNQLEEIHCTPRTGIDLLWYPDPITRRMAPKVWENPVLPYPTLQYHDAPIYAWYDDKDRLVLIRHSLELIPAYLPPVPDFSSYNIALCAPNVLRYRETRTPESCKGGFYCLIGQDIDKDLDFRKIDLKNTENYNALSKFGQAGITIDGPQCHPRADMVFCTPLPLGFYDWAEQGCQSGFYGIVTRGAVDCFIDYKAVTSGTPESVVIMPFLQSEGVYMGARVRERGTYSYIYQIGSVNIEAVNASGQQVNHRMFWYKSGEWGAGTMIDIDHRLSGDYDGLDVEFFLLTKRNRLSKINKIAEELRASSLNELVSQPSDVEGRTKIFKQVSLETDRPAQLYFLQGRLVDLFDPTLYGPDPTRYQAINCLEGVSGALYYPGDLNWMTQDCTDPLLPVPSDYIGTFVGHS